jgi:erythromycin esterase-like protein
MRQRHRHRTWPLRLRTLAVAGVVAVGGAAWLTSGSPTQAAEPGSPLTDWIQKNAQVIVTTGPDAPLDDLAGVRDMIGDAAIVGLGESAHGSSEEFQLKHRLLRVLVEELGFRSIAWEEDWTIGLQVNEYLLTGEGDLDELMARMSAAWQSQEVRAILEWLRDYNVSHEDNVQFVGVEFFNLGVRAYDAVEAYVAEVAPARLAELRRHLELLRPQSENHVGWYLGVDDKKPYIRAARAAYELIKDLPKGNGDGTEHGDRELALQHARQILSFYELYSLQDPSAYFQYRDERSAQNLRWWRQRTGDKVAWSAHAGHTANAPDESIPSIPGLQFDSAGSHVRRWYGQRYRSIGFTFDHGAVNAGWDQPPFEPQPVEVPPPAPEWAEAPLGEIGPEQFALDLHAGAPPAVRAWRQEPTSTRAIGPEYDPRRALDYVMEGGSLAQWFDVLVHRQEVTPWRPL